MKRIISVVLSTLLVFSCFGLVSFADTNSEELGKTTVVKHTLFVSVIDSANLASENYSLDNIDHYTMSIPLTEVEFKKLTKYSREELSDYLSNQNGINNLTNIENENVVVEKTGEEFSSLSLDQMIDGVVQPLSNQSIDGGVLTTVLTVSNQNTSTTCKKKIDFNFSWSPSPAASLTDSAAVGFTGAPLGLTNITNVSGWQQRMIAGSSTWGAKQSVSTSIAGAGVETHAIDPQYTDIKLSGGITFTVSNPKTAVTSGAYFTVFGQYAHTYIGFAPTASISSGGFSWSVGPTTRVGYSSQDQKANILTY